MGYRSEVVLALDKRLVPALMSAFAQSSKMRDLCTTETDNLITDYDGEGNWLMRWDNIKWYDSFPEIYQVETLLEAIAMGDLTSYGIDIIKDDEGKELPDDMWDELYKFIRIGEGADDIDQRGYGFYDVFLTRGINF
mgnify:CR=1 FL=1|tara:strand:+ start:169 stop:579 length:411 start_codon:yes stop_codon:yes gene_type:complete